MSNVTKTTLNSEKIDLIKKQFFPNNATELDMEYCLSVAKQYDLDPILKQVFFVSRRVRDEKTNQWSEKIEPLVGRDGFLTIAHKTGFLGGLETSCEIKSVPVLVKGKWEMVDDLVATCKVYRKDSSNAFVAEVSYREYVQLKSDGNPTAFWATKPRTMLKKVAESQALRKAFNINGIYAPEEIELTEDNNDCVIGNNYNEVVVQEIVEESKLNFIDVYKNFLPIGVVLRIDESFVYASGSTTANHKALKEAGFVYKNTQWVCPISNFIPATLRGFDVVSSLEKADIAYESKIKDNALWLKVNDSADNAIVSAISNLGFSQANGKDFYALKIA